MTTFEDASDGAATIPFRVRVLERALERIQDWKGTVDKERSVQTERLTVLDQRLDNLTRAVESLRRVILGFALSIAGSAVVFSASVLVATGKV